MVDVVLCYPRAHGAVSGGSLGLDPESSTHSEYLTSSTLAKAGHRQMLQLKATVVLDLCSCSTRPLYWLQREMLSAVFS
jgi:hypothetical protein